MKEPMSLRSTVAILATALTLVAVLVGGALVALTAILHRTTVQSSASVESVRLAAEAEIDLLLHARALDPVVRREIEGDLGSKLVEAQRYVTTDEEGRVLVEAMAQADEYIAAWRDPRRTDAERMAQQEKAYAALEEFVRINVEQSKDAQRDAARLDRFGNWIGSGIALALAAMAVGLVVWLQRGAFEPIFALAAAMKQFGRGDQFVRVQAKGGLELREMSLCFNEMAEAIAEQRQAEMAFLGGVAHDLRNPLSVLQLSVAVLRADERFAREASLRQIIDRMSRQIAQLQRMAEDFLDAARIEAGQLDLQLGAHDVSELVDGIRGQFADTGPGHRIEVRGPQGAVLLDCDRVRIEQVITNLLSNAIKYSPAGSTVEVVLGESADELELSVADHGCGISEQDRAHLFEPFRRVGEVRAAVAGVGLGLFVVRKIVEAHRGRIEVESTLGRGSRFRVFLPRAQEGAARLAGPGGPART